MQEPVLAMMRKSYHPHDTSEGGNYCYPHLTDERTEDER